MFRTRSEELKSKETGCKRLNSSVVPDTGSVSLREYLIPEVNAGGIFETEVHIESVFKFDTAMLS